MSTITLDASGQRPINATLNDPARTVAAIGTKPGDNITVSMSNVSEFTFLLPVEARIERVKNGSGESLRVTVGDSDADSPSWQTLSVCGRTVGQSQFPHAVVIAKKEIDPLVRSMETIAVVQDRAGDWIPATAPEITTEFVG